MASNYNLTPEKKAKLKKEILDEINKETQKPKEKKSNKLVAEPVKPRPLKVAPIKNNSAIEKKIKDDDSKLELKKEIKENIKKPIKKSIPKEKKKTVKKKVVSKKTPVATKKPKEAKKTVAVKKDVVSKPLPVKEDVKSIINDVKKETSLNSSIVDTDNLYKPKKTISKFKLIIGIAIFVVVVALLFLLINIFGIYKLEWDGKTSRAIANTFSLPAGTVDGRQIKLSDYFDDLEKVNLIMAESNNDPEVNREDIKNQLFDRLVSMIVVENELKKYGKEN